MHRRGVCRSIFTAALRVGDLVVRGLLIERALLGLHRRGRGSARAGQRPGIAAGEGHKGSKEKGDEGGSGKGLHRLVFLVSLNRNNASVIGCTRKNRPSAWGDQGNCELCLVIINCLKQFLTCKLKCTPAGPACKAERSGRDEEQAISEESQ